MTNTEFMHLVVKSSDNRRDDVSSHYVYRDYDFDIIPYHKMESLLGREWKSKCIKLMPLLNFIAKKVNKHSIVYISQTDEKLLKNYKSHQSVADNIRYLCDCKVLVDFGSTYLPHKQAKSYLVCVDNLHTIFDIYYSKCSTSNKKKPSVRNLDSLYKNIFFRTELRINSDEYTDKEIESCLFLRYPSIRYYKNLVDWLNKSIYRAEEKILFDISIRRTPKRISKIGIRAFSDVCYYKSIIKENKKLAEGENVRINVDAQYREYYLNNRFGEFEEYDVNASIPRVSRAMLSGGDLGDLEKDVYYAIFGDFVSDYTEYVNANVSSWCKEVRDYFKGLCLRLYFGGEPQNILAKLLRTERKEAEKNNITHLPYAELDKKGVLLGLIKRWKKAVVNFCGQHNSVFDTSVFYHESCIYLEVRRVLAERGIDVVQVYDGFFFKKGTMPSDMDDILRQATKRYLNVSKTYYEMLSQSLPNTVEWDAEVSDFMERISSENKTLEEVIENFFKQEGLCISNK